MINRVKINYIYDVIYEERNVWNEVEWDFYINKVMIWDVLDFIEKNDLNNIRFDNKTGIVLNTYDDILDEWQEKRKPIEEQSDDCIDYIYNLIK